MAVIPPPPPPSTGLVIDGVVFTGTSNDLLTATLVKLNIMVTIDLKDPNPTGFAYQTLTSPINIAKITASAALTQLNACLFNGPVKPNRDVVAVLKNLLTYSGVPGGFDIQEPPPPSGGIISL